MKRIVWFVIAVLGVAACSEVTSAPSAPTRLRPGERSPDMTCRSGYVIAYYSDGTAYCAPDSTQTSSAMTTTSSTSSSTTTPQ